MKHRPLLSICSACSLLGLFAATGLHAQQPLAAETVTTTADTTFIHQFAADLDNGGDVSVSSAGLRFDMAHSLHEGRSIGWGMSYKADFFSFEGDSGIGQLDPWDTINTVTLNSSYMTPLGNEWNFRVAPSISAAGESSASVSDSMTYGAVFAFTRRFSETLTMGLGAGFYTGIEDTRGFPIIAIRWNFAPGWMLQNPLHPGPSGPAGLELAYDADTWEFGIGAAYREYRFRLADDGVIADGIGQYTSIPLYVRASRSLTENIRLNLFGGVLFGGSIDLEDSDGNEVTDSDFDPAPLLAFSLSGRF